MLNTIDSQVEVVIVLAMFFSYIKPIAEVIALSYGEGENFIKLDIDNDLGFTIDSVTINGDQWTNTEDEFHTTDNQYHIEINVSGNDTTGEKIPRLGYGGNWNDYVTPSTHHNGNNHTFILDVNNANHEEFMGLFL